MARLAGSSLGQRPFRYFDLVMALFVAVLLISNVASSAKFVDWGISILGLRLAFDAGTILFPLSYIFGDILTEVYGYRRSRRVIWMGFACNALLAGTLALVGILPGAEEWRTGLAVTTADGRTGGAELAYAYLLGTTGRIVIASLLAYFAGEFSNSFVLAKMKIWTRGRWLWTRTIGSTLVGEGVDTLLFVLIAFAGVWSWELVGATFLTNYLFKVGVEAVMTPATYRVVHFLKRAEQEDYYDYDTDFNPFRLREG
ncbi:MAG: queuosine precursor transporter [Chloroflexia bacterium]